MQISARGDYAVRALCVLAVAPRGEVTKAEDIATAQQIPRAFLDQVLLDLRRAGLVRSQRGPHGGHALTRSPGLVSVADAVRAMEGPLALVHGQRPEDTQYVGPAAQLQDVWVALRAAVRDVLEQTTIEHIVTRALPGQVTDRSGDARAWEPAARRPLIVGELPSASSRSLG